jgi:hypothetical protein
MMIGSLMGQRRIGASLYASAAGGQLPLGEVPVSSDPGGERAFWSPPVDLQAG